MTKKVLYLSYDGMTDPLGQSQVLPYLQGLSKQGYQFTLVSFEKKKRYQSTKTVIEDICRRSGIEWIPLFYTKRPPVLSTLKDIRSMKKIAGQLHKSRGFHLVHCRSYIPALVGLWMKKRYGIRFIFDMRGFWADERVDGGLWNLGNPVYRAVYGYFKKKEKQFLEEADYIISLTKNAREEIYSWPLKKQPVPIQVIPCCVDLDLFNPELITRQSVDAKKEALNIKDSDLVITYIGSVGTWYMLDEMLDFFRVLLGQHPRSIFLFVTPDAEDHIITAASQKKIPAENLRITFAKRVEVPLFISLSDFSVFFIKPLYSKKASSPTKQGEIMAMGKPVICNTNIGDTDSVIKNYNSGLVIENFSVDYYRDVLKEMNKDNFSFVKIREGAKDFFSLEKGVSDYAAIYHRVLNEAD